MKHTTIVAAFTSGGECRGVGMIGSGPSGRLYQLSVGVKSASESGFSLKLWDAASGNVYDIDGTLSCNADKIVGRIEAPLCMEIVANETISEIAADATAATVDAVIDATAFADVAGVKAAIGGSAVEYAAFKAWAGSVKNSGGSVAGEAAVMANTNAATAYLLGAERLFENAPTIEIGDLAVGEDGVPGSEGTITVSVTVKDGEDPVAVASEKVKEMFEATGDLGDWDGAAKLVPTVTEVTGGHGSTLRFKVKPGDGSSPKAFLRIRK